MTTPNHPAGRPSGLWRWYTDANTAARDSYLAVTYHAHRQYLTGPWPDRETYQRVENTAWQVYYQASRDTWHKYTAALECPCCTRGGTDCTCPDDCGTPRCQAADPPLSSPPDANTHPVSEDSYHSAAYQHARAQFHPTDGGTQ